MYQIDYKEKYLKYRNKYLQLKRKNGGGLSFLRSKEIESEQKEKDKETEIKFKEKIKTYLEEKKGLNNYVNINDVVNKIFKEKIKNTEIKLILSNTTGKDFFEVFAKNNKIDLNLKGEALIQLLD